MAIKNIIFDLGGVILNIDFKKTEQAFTDLGLTNFSELYTQFHATPFFVDYETGKINDNEFIAGFRNGFNKELTDNDVINAWNALLLDFPDERLQLLKNLKKKYRLFLLSNTNALHHAAFQKRISELPGNPNLDDYFEKAYYSHVMGMRKPDVDIYKWVIEKNNLVPGETLFIDDTPANIEGAKQAGLQTVYLKYPATILELDL